MNRGEGRRARRPLAPRWRLGAEEVERRRSLLPGVLNYPAELPVSAARERIAAAIAEHQVVVLAGDTGSGKTTQLPKICLELGRGVAGMIGHTQPRRIAAQAVAARLAEELGADGERLVAWQVRFADRSTPDTLVKLMTDGILLAEIRRDRRLERYDTLIIDEAHERSLNIDFLLGYLHRLLRERRDLKLVITSATIDVERFSRHFGNAPVIEVSGRTWPVEVWYRPGTEDADTPAAIVSAIGEIIDHERAQASATRGDILVFHAGERDIRESALAIRRAGLPQLEVYPLYARLSREEQARVLRPSRGGARRVVLATNVAETSLTVPGIRYVIDPGYARVSRYSVRSKVQRLPIEPISRASADQRKGRCGRLGAGLCIRLYGEQDFESRAAFSEPEILRTGLASVILQMEALGLGQVARFPFLDPPDERQVRDGVRLLEELGAMQAGRLSAIGRQLARFPVDPRLGRMLLAGAQLGALAEMLVIASFLSIQDPRERPLERQQAADESHRRFADQQSDFVAILKLWEYIEKNRQELSAAQFRRLCSREFLSWLRVREWRDIHFQLRLLAREAGLAENSEHCTVEALHRAVLSGMLTHIGTRTEERDYEGVRGRRFVLHPSSGLFRRQPKWLVSAELVETSRIYARVAAAIDPLWVLQWAENLVKREQHSAAWSASRGKVLARETIRLFGLVISDSRSVDYARVDRAKARSIFIQSALVEEDYAGKRAFWTHNRTLRAEIAELETRQRRHDIAVDDRVLFEFYDARLPAEVCDHPSLENWLGAEPSRRAESLCMQRAQLLRSPGSEPGEAQFPDALQWQGMRFALAYRFEPGHPADGVTVCVPVALLQAFPCRLADWLVPGLLADKLVALLKGLPKQWRKPLVPVPDSVNGLMGELRRADVALVEALGEAIERLRGVRIPRDAWREQALDPFYRMNMRVIGNDGEVLGEGRDIAQLQRELGAVAREAVRSASPTRFDRTDIRDWDFGPLPQRIRLEGAAGLDACPVLRDLQHGVAIEPVLDQREAVLVHRAGVRRLSLLRLASTVTRLRRELLRDARGWIGLASRFDRAALTEDLLLAALDACIGEQELPRDAEHFAELVERCNAALPGEARRMEALVTRIATALHEVDMARGVLQQPVFAESRLDVDEQLVQLFEADFLHHAPRNWLERYPVYLQALALRLQKLPQRLGRDLEHCAEMARLQEPLRRYFERHPGPLARSLCAEYRWLLEEYRVSLFAQQLGTAQPVSVRRLDRLWESLSAEQLQR